MARITDALENPGKAYDMRDLLRHYPDIRLIYWAGAIPYHHHQDLHRMARAWTRPDTIVIQDPMWTARARADVVLPASTSLERNDIAGNSRSDMIIAMKQVIAPMGEAIRLRDLHGPGREARRARALHRGAHRDGMDPPSLRSVAQ
ncbi:MAG: molybdopterin-dependent oxidoreductase [Burkholderiaceae bacterium]